MTKGSILGVIPARLNSTRFPEKVLALINKKPMIQYVWESAARSELRDNLWVATDSEKIAGVVEGFGGRVWKTPSHFLSGTERVTFVAENESESEIIVNVQGDEPLITPSALDQLIAEVESDPGVGMATLAVRHSKSDEGNDPNVVKVLFSKSQEALYFSRKPLAAGPEGEFFKHIGVYAFRKSTLSQLSRLPCSLLERSENLEQLRALEHGFRIKVVIIDTDTIAVDNPSDIMKVEKFLSRAGKVGKEVPP